MIEEFVSRASAARCVVVRVPGPEEATEAVARLVEGHRAVVDDIDLLAGLPPVTTPADPWEAEVGVCEAFAAAAESGSLALVQRPGAPRRTSLLPAHSVVVLSEERIRPTYQAMIDDIVALDPPPTGVQVVTGPSRSGDIESAMIHGMHGPNRVTIVLVGA